MRGSFLVTLMTDQACSTALISVRRVQARRSSKTNIRTQPVLGVCTGAAQVSAPRSHLTKRATTVTIWVEPTRQRRLSIHAASGSIACVRRPPPAQENLACSRADRNERPRVHVRGGRCEQSICRRTWCLPCSHQRRRPAFP